MNIREKVELELRGIREKNNHLNLLRKRKLYEENPILEELDERSKELMVESVTKGKDNTLEFDNIIKKREDYLKNLDIRDELKPHYNCEICKDTGYVNNEMCVCLKKMIQLEYFKVGESSGIIKNSTFENFNFNLFSDLKEPGASESLRSFMKSQYKRALKYADEFSTKGKGIIFFGNSGTGKTYLSGAIANRVRENGFTVIYMTANEIVSAIREKDYGDFNFREDAVTKYNLIKDVDLLVIDDLGIETATQYTTSALFEIINYRSALEKPIIYSTNFMLTDLSKRYHDRIFSRITGSTYQVEIFGNNIRYR